MCGGDGEGLAVVFAVVADARTGLHTRSAQADIMAQDTEVESSSGEVKEGYEAISMANLYYLGGGAHEIVNHRIGANKQRNFFASAPKVVFGDHYAQ